MTKPKQDKKTGKFVPRKVATTGEGKKKEVVPTPPPVALDTLVCADCGVELREGQKFCPGCGNELVWE